MARCLHFGMELVGNRCPLHGLTYPLPKDCFIKEFRQCPDILAEEIQERDAEIGRQFLTIEQKVNAPFYLWMLNTMDYRHLMPVHASGFGLQFDPGAEPYDVRISTDKKRSSHKLKVRDAVVSRYQGICSKPIKNYFQHWALYPSVSYTDFLGVFYSFETVTPIDDKSCVVTTSFSLSKTRSLPDSILNSASRANARILNEDKLICEAWARTFVKTGNWLRGDERQKAYLEVLEGDGDAFKIEGAAPNT